MVTDKKYALVAGSTYYYFPGGHLFRNLTKDLLKMQIPSFVGGNNAWDILRATRSFRIEGYWQDDPDGEYDGKTAFRRYLDLMRIAKGQKGDEPNQTYPFYIGNESHNVIIQDVSIKKQSGYGDVIDYVISLAVVTPIVGG